MCCCLQTVVSRGTSPLESHVVSLSSFNTGSNAYNVIPDTVQLGGTYRSLTHKGIVWMKEQFQQVKVVEQQLAAETGRGHCFGFTVLGSLCWVHCKAQREGDTHNSNDVHRSSMTAILPCPLLHCYNLLGLLQALCLDSLAAGIIHSKSLLHNCFLHDIYSRFN